MYSTNNTIQYVTFFRHCDFDSVGRQLCGKFPNKKGPKNANNTVGGSPYCSTRTNHVLYQYSSVAVSYMGELCVCEYAERLGFV